MFEKDREAYYRYFPRPEGKLAGEWTPRYMNVPGVVDTMKALAPEAKLLVLLRDPVERYRSGVGQWQKRKERRGKRLNLWAGRKDAYARSFYAFALRPYVEAFGRDQMLILQFEKCLQDPAGSTGARWSSWACPSGCHRRRSWASASTWPGGGPRRRSSTSRPTWSSRSRRTCASCSRWRPTSTSRCGPTSATSPRPAAGDVRTTDLVGHDEVDEPARAGRAVARWLRAAVLRGDLDQRAASRDPSSCRWTRRRLPSASTARPPSAISCSPVATIVGSPPPGATLMTAPIGGASPSEHAHQAVVHHLGHVERAVRPEVRGR